MPRTQPSKGARKAENKPQRGEKMLKKTGTIRKRNFRVTVLSATEKLKSPQQRSAENWWATQLFGHRLSREVRIHHARREKPNAVFTRNKSKAKNNAKKKAN